MKRPAFLAIAIIVVIIGAATWFLNHKAQFTGESRAPAGVVQSAPDQPAAPAAATGIRQLHTPGAFVDDMHLAAGSCHVVVKNASTGLILPDPRCTPGAIDPAVTQENIHSTICVSGYTSTIRPPSSATSASKSASLGAYAQSSSKTTEYDHLISLQLGGTNTTSNLWPEPNRAGAPGTTNPKDAVETKLKNAVCSGAVTLAAAQQAIATDWTTAEQTLGIH